MVAPIGIPGTANVGLGSTTGVALVSPSNTCATGEALTICLTIRS